MTRRESFPGWRKNTTKRFSGKRAINREIAAIGRQDFRTRRQLGQGYDACVGKARVEVRKFLKPAQQKTGMRGDIKIGRQIAIYQHLEQGFRIPDQVSRFR